MTSGVIVGMSSMDAEDAVRLDEDDPRPLAGEVTVHRRPEPVDLRPRQRRRRLAGQPRVRLAAHVAVGEGGQTVDGDRLGGAGEIVGEQRPEPGVAGLRDRRRARGFASRPGLGARAGAPLLKAREKQMNGPAATGRPPGSARRRGRARPAGHPQMKREGDRRPPSPSDATSDRSIRTPASSRSWRRCPGCCSR